ncbi:MAG: adenylate/guanylate cyclase domain-containing protein [Stellaceae bacterium]
MASTELDAPPEARAPRTLGLRAALTGLVLLTVAVTAILIHLTWFYNARRNVADVVGQLNRQIVGSVQHEVRGTLNDAWSVQEAVQSIFFQEAIKPTDEAKREFIFLALLRSHPTLSWIALGFPDGAFFGALKAGDNEIDMVEVKQDPETGNRQQRVDTYTPEPGDVMFRGREITPSDYKATAQPWYQRAVAENGPGWSMLSHLPYRDRPAIVTSTPLVINLDFAGVVAVVVELDRLSQFIAGLQVGKTGTVVLLDRSGRVVASAALAALKGQRRGETPELKTLARDHPMLASVDVLLQGGSLTLTDLRETRQLQMTSPADGKNYFVTFSPLNFNSWAVATVIPASDFLASIERSAMILLIALAVLTVVVAAIAILLANRLLAAPLLRIAGQLKHIEDFRLDRVIRLASPLREFDDLSSVLLQMSRGLASFQKYMPTELVRTLVSQGVEARPGGQQQTLTVMFTDVAGFTGISEELGDRVVPVLAQYLEAVSAAVLNHCGTIDKFIGDGVMAFWGAPVPNERHAIDACAAALECQRLLAVQRSGAERCGGTPLRMRVGINTGRMLVGNIGSSERLSYTVIGDPVNVASRLEPLGKIYGVDIIIGEDTRIAAGDAIIVRRLDLVSVYGRIGGLAIYELLSMAEGAGDEVPEWVGDYEAGLAAYEGRNWSEAARLFEAAAATRGSLDRPSEILAERCRACLIDPPPDSWMPVSVLELKA